MAKPTQQISDRKETGEERSQKHLPLMGIVAIFIIALVALLWPLIHNESLHSANANDTRTNTQSLLSKITSPGKQVYSNVVDIGCDSGSSVGLARVIHCDYIGYKYFTHQGNLSTDLHSVNSTLTSNGWTRSLYNTQTNADFDASLSGTGNYSIRYQQPDNKHVSVGLGYYINDKQMNEYTIQKLIDDKKIPSPTSEEYIYGVKVTATYWSCRETSSFKLRCPTPPGELNKVNNVY